MDFEAVGVELLVAVGAGGLVGLGVAAELALNDGVGGQHHVSILQLLSGGGPLVAVVYHDLQGACNRKVTTINPDRWCWSRCCIQIQCVP